MNMFRQPFERLDNVPFDKAYGYRPEVKVMVYGWLSLKVLILRRGGTSSIA